MLNHRKSREWEQVKETDTLDPKGMKSGQHGSKHMVTNGHMISGLQMAPKVLRSIYGVELGKPNVLPVMGRSSARKNDGAVGRGIGKKRKATCNESHRGLLDLKGC